MTDQKQMNTVDSMLPIPQLFAFGLQTRTGHVCRCRCCTYYCGTGHELTYGDLIRLITADLFYPRYCHINPNIRFWQIGGRIPMIQGVTLFLLVPWP